LETGHASKWAINLSHRQLKNGGTTFDNRTWKSRSYKAVNERRSPAMLHETAGYYWARRRDDGTLSILRIVRPASGAPFCQLMANLNRLGLAQAAAIFVILQRIPPPTDGRHANTPVPAQRRRPDART
jgi:hypothetical protein